MEQLRWIILGVGIVVVLLIYLFSRSKNRQKQELPFQYEDDDLPSLRADEESESVAGIKGISTSGYTEEVILNQELIEQVASGVDDGLHEAITVAHAERKKTAHATDDIPENHSNVSDLPEELPSEPESPADDLLIIYIRSASAFISGEQLALFINKYQLKFGDMKLYHARDDDGKIIFSMSNMIEPGYFEPEKIKELQTPGVILFMQLGLVAEPVNGFRQMLYTAQSMAQEFNARLFDASQHELENEDFEQMQNKASRFETE